MVLSLKRVPIQMDGQTDILIKRILHLGGFTKDP